MKLLKQTKTEWPDSHKKEALKMIAKLKPTVEGAGLQFPGCIMLQVQQRCKNKLYEMIDMAKVTHR